MDFLSEIGSIFSYEYMLSVIAVSYFILKFIDSVNGEKVIPTWLKQVVTVVVGGLLFAIFKIWTEIQMETLLVSFFASLFLYDTIIRVILKKLRIGYRSERCSRQ